MEKFEKKNVIIAPNVLLAKKEKQKERSPGRVSEHNSYREKQIIRLMISNGDGWHYLAVKKD